jgi:hypothetical protein
MRYLIDPGSVVTVRGGPIDEVRMGDVVLLKTHESLSGHFLIHRVISIHRDRGKLWLRTKGDSSPRDLQRFTAKTCLGKVTLVATPKMQFRLDRRFWRPINVVAAYLSRFSAYFVENTPLLRGKSPPQRQILPQRVANSILKRLLRLGKKRSRVREPRSSEGRSD